MHIVVKHFSPPRQVHLLPSLFDLLPRIYNDTTYYCLLLLYISTTTTTRSSSDGMSHGSSRLISPPSTQLVHWHQMFLCLSTGCQWIWFLVFPCHGGHELVPREQVSWCLTRGGSGSVLQPGGDLRLLCLLTARTLPYNCLFGVWLVQWTFLYRVHWGTFPASRTLFSFHCRTAKLIQLWL